MDFQDEIERAIAAVDNARLADAEQIYHRLLTYFPDNKIVKHLLREVEGSMTATSSGTKAEKRLLKGFVDHQSHLFTVPEYNLNWGLKDLNPISEFLKDNLITVVDVGARDGFLGEIEDLRSFTNYIGFDSDQNEVDRLTTNEDRGYASFKVLPYFIGKNEGPVYFNIFNSPGHSSIFRPSKAYIEKFDPSFGIRSTVQVNSMPLDKALENEKVNEVNFLKLDTQGSELAILKSSEDFVKNILLIEAEVEIFEIYEGQPLIGEFLAYMNKLGFEVLYINRVFQSRRGYEGLSRGQVVFCDFLFAKREDHALNATAHQLSKHLILLCAYGHLDMAHYLWNASSEVKKLIPDLGVYFVKKPTTDVRIEQMNRDKILCWQLHKRISNQLDFDSDRSWPIR
jgi:FkbM family methyltransferase